MMVGSGSLGLKLIVNRQRQQADQEDNWASGACDQSEMTSSWRRSPWKTMISNNLRNENDCKLLIFGQTKSRWSWSWMRLFLSRWKTRRSASDGGEGVADSEAWWRENGMKCSFSSRRAGSVVWRMNGGEVNGKWEGTRKKMWEIACWNDDIRWKNANFNPSNSPYNRK